MQVFQKHKLMIDQIAAKHISCQSFVSVTLIKLTYFDLTEDVGLGQCVTHI